MESERKYNPILRQDTSGSLFVVGSVGRLQAAVTAVSDAEGE
jgi:hypothetical protein